MTPTRETTVEENPASGGSPESGVARDAPGWRTWTSSRRWELLITALTAVLYGWGLSQNGYGNLYYAASVKGMNSPMNFLFGSFDQGGWETVDKPPMSQWMTALSARIFGFSSWSLLMPSVLCGALSVWLLMAVVRRPWGRTAGLVAGVVLATTPIMLAVSRSNNPDALLVFLAICAAWATQRGFEDGRLRWMVLTGVFAGFGFLTKSLAVGAVLPGMWLAHLVAGPGPIVRKRMMRCVAGGLVFLLIAGGSLLVVQAVPLSRRPWIGSSRDGSAIDLVFGHNGLDLMFGKNNLLGFVKGPNGLDQFGGTTGWRRLFNQGMGDQAMWLSPIALVAAAGAIAAAIRRRKRDARLGSTVLWTSWALLGYVILSSASGTFHNYYVSIEVPALAALVGIGAELAVEAKRVGYLVAAVALAGTAVLQVNLLDRVDAWTWLRLVVPAGAGLALVAMLVIAMRSSTPRPVLLGVLGAGLAVLALAPMAWSLEGVRHPPDPTFPDARPSDGLISSSASAGVARIDPAELAWLRSQRRNERWTVGVSSVLQAELDAIDGESVVALGGFVGADKSDSVERVSAAVERGELRFIVVGGGMRPGGGSSAAVIGACERVDPSEWGSTSAGVGVLYDCAGRADAMRAVPAPQDLAPPSPGLPGGSPPPGLPPPDSPLARFGTCTIAHGGDPRELAQAGTGKPLSPALRAAMAQCMDLFPGQALPMQGGAPSGAGTTPSSAGN